jgi:uncharacterized coiled-coil protein SlyX
MAETRVTVRQVPLAVAVTVALQTGGGLIWVGSADARLGDVERQVAVQAEAPVRLARVEEQVAAVRAQLERIEGKVDALGPKGARGG